jgi:hypothetical protein
LLSQAADRRPQVRNDVDAVYARALERWRVESDRLEAEYQAGPPDDSGEWEWVEEEEAE